MFGISDMDLMDPNKIKILDGIAGSGKSTTTVAELRRLGSNFCLASFSNALKFAAADKFGCPTSTICGLEFINNPYPRAEEKDVEGYDTVVNDEILLDGVECIRWMDHHVGKVNIIALTDSKQMLSAENSDNVLKEFKKLCKQDYVICVNITDTKRARDDETKEVYDTLFRLDSDRILNVNQAAELLHCDIIDMSTIDFDPSNTYLCHSNKIEHDIYKKFDIQNRKDIDLIPKNHISRQKFFDVNKYPICDQITATSKNIDAYLQAAMIASPTRFQGKEVEVGNDCYFIVQENDVFTGREIYTVGTRCQSIKSLHIAVLKIQEYDDPARIHGKQVVKAFRLDIPDADKKYHYVNNGKIADIIKRRGEKDKFYFNDMIMSGNNVIYSSLSKNTLSRFADFHDDGTVTLRLKKGGARTTIKSITKKDTTMHFDYMPRVYSLLGIDVTPPRINNPEDKYKTDFNKLCDIYSAFPTVLNHAPMPKAGYIYEEYDSNLLNFYLYKGDVVTKYSLITEELADKLGDSEYIFSTEKQEGCALGRYTYEQCKKSKEDKAKINKDFLWGKLESGYYTRELVTSVDGSSVKYVKHPGDNLELVACALWSSLCCVMLDAISSLNTDSFYVVTDGLYYNGDKNPEMPGWCDYRIELKDWNAEKTDEKYNNIVFKTYKDPKTKRDIKNAKDRERRKKMTPEQKAKEAERKRIARAKAKANA